jgi:hypothetical protein
MCTIASAAALTNSTAKSRSDTASSEFSQSASKPSSRATAARSIGKLVPASAALPSVAREHCVVRHEVMPERHRLRDLKVRVARHDRVGVPLGEVEQRTAQATDAAEERVDRSAQPQAHVGCDLVVARARGVQSLAGVADQRGETPLDVEVHILERARPLEAARRDVAAEARKAVLDRRQVRGGQDALRGEHPGVRQRARDVRLGEAAVHVDRGVEPLHPLGHGFGEAAGPCAAGRHCPVAGRHCDTRFRTRAGLAGRLVGLRVGHRLCR